MPRKRSEEFTGRGASVQSGVKSYDGKRPGAIDDILRERQQGPYNPEKVAADFRRDIEKMKAGEPGWTR